MDERGKAFYAQHDAEAKDLERWVLKRDKTAYAQHDQRIGVCSRPHVTRLFTHSMAGDCDQIAQAGGSAGLSPLQLLYPFA